MPELQRPLPPKPSFARRAKRRLYWEAQRLAAWPSHLIKYFLATPYYDRVVSRGRQTFDGHVGASARVAIVLIFPRQGLKPSHLRTLSYFAEKGYAPLVVSNLPLVEADRKAVLNHCWRLIERPNFGYDFGGLRDGILSLGQELDRLERLVLVNDSCWFPLPGASDWIDDVDALGVDFAGAACNYGIAGPEAEHYRSISWAYRPTLPHFHYCSFALSFSRTLLRDPRFRNYWQRLRLTNDKRLVVQRGEVGLTQWILKNGFSHGATLDISRLDADLESCAIERIQQITRELIIPEDPRLRAVKASVLDRYDGSESWRRDAVRFILTTVAATGVSYALPEFTVQEKRFPFLKKSPLWLDDEGAGSTLRIVSRLGGTAGAEIRAEAEELQGQRTPSASKRVAVD